MTPDAMRALVHRHIEEGFNLGDWTVCETTLADDYTDLVADGLHNPVAQGAILTTKPVALPQARGFKSESWMDRASRSFDGGY